MQRLATGVDKLDRMGGSCWWLVVAMIAGVWSTALYRLAMLWGSSRGIVWYGIVLPIQHYNGVTVIYDINNWSRMKDIQWC